MNMVFGEGPGQFPTPRVWDRVSVETATMAALIKAGTAYADQCAADRQARLEELTHSDPETEVVELSDYFGPGTNEADINKPTSHTLGQLDNVIELAAYRR